MLRNICIGLILLSSWAFAQTDTTDRTKMLGLRFSINGLNLGGGLGVKYWLAPQGALAVGANFTTNSVVMGGATSSLGFSIQYEYHFLQREYQISPYLAGGFGAGFSIIEENTVTGMPVTRTSFSAGVSGVIGIEFFATSAISFAGQQAVGVTYTQYPSNAVPQLRQERWDIGFGATSLILHVYFARL